jgi:hypothetical protein
VAANLAVAFCNLGERTLLIDADLRAPRQRPHLQYSDRIGPHGGPVRSSRPRRDRAGPGIPGGSRFCRPAYPRPIHRSCCRAPRSAVSCRNTDRVLTSSCSIRRRRTPARTRRTWLIRQAPSYCSPARPHPPGRYDQPHPGVERYGRARRGYRNQRLLPRRPECRRF